jgi:type VI secretion system protein
MKDPEIPEGMEEQFFNTVGQLFRLSTEGLIDILRARADIKSAFRMNMTTIQPVENNPLKFSLCTDDALNALIKNPGGACLSADQAFKEGFNDIKAHELAVMAGMQGALGDVLKRFEPQALASYFESQGGKRLLQQKKSWYWEQYIQQHKELLSEAEDQFQTLFGAAFTTAYENQVAKLKATTAKE